MFVYHDNPRLPDFLQHYRAVSVAQLDFQVSTIDAGSFVQNGIPLPANFDTMLAKRRCEFLAGRLCAQQALKQLNSVPSEVGVNSDRSPAWPTGFIGSITHTTGIAAACVARSSDYSHLGIDIEHVVSTAVMEKIYSTILTHDEQVNFNRLNTLSFSQEQYLTLIFSAKESLFKALYYDVGYRFDFNAASLLEVNQQDILLVLQDDLAHQWPKGRVLKLDYCLVNEHVYTLLALSP